MEENTTPPVKQETPWVGYIIMAIIVIAMFKMCSSCGDDDKSKTSTETKKEDKIEFTSEMNSTLTLAESEGWVKMKPYDREIWVDPAFWNTADYDQKMGLGYIAAVKSADVLNSDLYYVNILDMKTGKKLGKWSKSWGFEVE